MFLQNPSYVHEKFLKQAFSVFIEDDHIVKFVAFDKTVISFNRNLLIFNSSLLRNILSDRKNDEETVIILPECSSSTLEHLKNVFTKGFTDFTPVKDIKEASTMLGIDIENFDYYADNTSVDSPLPESFQPGKLSSRNSELEENVAKGKEYLENNIEIKIEPQGIKEESCDDLITETLEELSGYFSKNREASPLVSQPDGTSKDMETGTKAGGSPATKGTKRPVEDDDNDVEDDDFSKKIRGSKKCDDYSKKIRGSNKWVRGLYGGAQGSTVGNADSYEKTDQQDKLEEVASDKSKKVGKVSVRSPEFLQGTSVPVTHGARLQHQSPSPNQEHHPGRLEFQHHDQHVGYNQQFQQINAQTQFHENHVNHGQLEFPPLH